MSRCKSCRKKVGIGGKFSFPIEKINKVCEECFDRLMKEKGYDVVIAPEGYKVYTFDDGKKYRQYIPKGPPSHIIASKDDISIREKVYLDTLNRKLEATAKRIEKKHS
jgi:hypothetical protein